MKLSNVAKMAAIHAIALSVHMLYYRYKSDWMLNYEYDELHLNGNDAMFVRLQ